MKKTYLYQLYQYSRPAYWLALAFIFAYSFFFYKKMDMLLFPHNSMFAHTPPGKQTAHTYGIHLNDSLVKTTGFPYWKKDFIESSLDAFARYQQNDRKVYLQQYFESSGSFSKELQEKLVPGEKSAAAFLPWLLNYAGRSIGNNSKTALYRYTFVFESGRAVLKDSMLVFSQKNSRR